MARLSSVWEGMPMSTRPPTVSIVMPILNEERNLPLVAACIPPGIDEIICVDGNSVDNSAEVCRQLWPDGIHITQTRTGKGNALACGIAASSGDIIVTLDADGSADPRELPQYIGALVAGADFAKGSRFILGGGSADITRFRQLGNWCLNRIVNLLFSMPYTDLCYGYNAFWRHCLPAMHLPAVDAVTPQWGDGFEIETLINVRVGVHDNLKIAEVCSYEASRVHGVSNLHAIRDGFRVLRTIMYEFQVAHSRRGRVHRYSEIRRFAGGSEAAS